MKEIKSYNDLPIVSKLQQSRLYLQCRPLLRLWTKKRHGSQFIEPEFVKIINSELDGNFIAIDCGGWYFSDQSRRCTAIEIMPQSRLYHDRIFYEYDYLTWRPTYLNNSTVLAYHSCFFRYADINEFLSFFQVWGAKHQKLIVGFDPTKIKNYNYLKTSILTVLKSRFPNYNITPLLHENFNLLIKITQK